MFFWNSWHELSHEQLSKTKLSQVWDRGSLMSPRAGERPQESLTKRKTPEADREWIWSPAFKECTFYCVYVGEDTMARRWRSQDSLEVFLSPLLYGIWHQTCRQTCWNHLVSSNSLHFHKLPDDINADWWPMDHILVAGILVHCCQTKYFCNGGNSLHLWLQGIQNVGSATDKQNL